MEKTEVAARVYQRPGARITVALLFLCAGLFQTLPLSLTHGSPVPAPDLNPAYLEISSLIIDGSIVSKKEIWNRSSNPLMGRPDFLVEILLRVNVRSVLKGSLPENDFSIGISIKGQDLLIRYKALPKGSRGVFYLSGINSPYDLKGYEPLSNQAVAAAAGGEKHGDGAFFLPEKIGGREILQSKSLQARVVRMVARKYGLKDAGILTMISFSGPEPPPGGYVYWGVRGKVGKKWYIWQHGSNGRLREGRELVDPHRYEK